MVQIPMDLCETHIIGADTREWIIMDDNSGLMRQFQMLGVGLSDAALPYEMVRLNPVHLHILVCSGGEGEVLIGGEWKPCGPQQAYISPVGKPMAFRAVKGKRWKFSWIFFQGQTAVRLFPHPESVLWEADANLFETIIRELHRELVSHREESVVTSWVQLLHTAALRLLKPPTKQFRLQPLWQEVAGNPAKAWNMTALARRAGLSEEHLRRISLAETGHSPMKHVTFLRLQKAAHLLETSQLKMSAIAEAVGYQDAFAFSTAFKRHLGCSPSAYTSHPGGKRPA